MADDKDPSKQLKDLTQLKKQLQELRSRVEGEISADTPYGGSGLASPLLKGFVAGYVVAKLRFSAIVGVLLGTVTGVYAAQTYQVPNIERTVKHFFNKAKTGPKE
ncbi:SLC35A4 upstream open reading frame protein-like [Periophthalmus magnuspinnatus]|uniref:SLC35A4 upstream open reading frame protein-like n=1 Tax=Periophthalmus magnuspinnatus TaxID=409849 RepID=UPI00145A60CA|nr:SLC35A4 upstream open reading frame protein-like [Periophthalmus magnuspinnatus]